MNGAMRPLPIGRDSEDGAGGRVRAVLDLDQQEGGEARHAHLRAGEEAPPEEGGCPRKGEDLAIARKHGTDSYGEQRGTQRSVRVTPTARCDRRIAWGQTALSARGRAVRRVNSRTRGVNRAPGDVFVVEFTQVAHGARIREEEMKKSALGAMALGLALAAARV